jgi:YggT family protein
VIPARRIIPGLWRLDLSTLVLAWVTEVLLLGITFWLRGFEFGPAVGTSVLVLVLLGTVAIVKLTLYIVMAAVIVQAVLSWVAPYSPAMPLLNSFSRPFLGIFQRRIPPVGNVDLSPIFVIVACQLLLYVVAWAEGSLVRAIG